jgi:hypothetical protein
MISRTLRLNHYAMSGIIVALVLLIIGFAHDVASFDETRGGYEAPYTDFSGDPIDWDVMAVTETGFEKSGWTVTALVNCSSGMISFRALGVELPYRTLSQRALAIHRPIEACHAAGFDPTFDPGAER